MTGIIGKLVCLLVVAYWIASSKPVQAWGALGHEIICEIAFQELGKEARTEVKRLIKLDPTFATFSRSCIWPDHPRKRAKEHYVNVARSSTEFGTAICPKASKCVLLAIGTDVAVLSDKSASDERRLASLKYLGHWVGDVHQPFHVSFKDDRGGNSIGERGGPCDGNLHAVWDTCMVKSRLRGKVREIAKRMVIGVTSEQRSAWTKNAPIMWAAESYQIVTKPSVGYWTWKERSCWYDQDRQKYKKGQPQKSIVVNKAYIALHGPIVEAQLTNAGVRLGAFLNQLLASD